MGFRYWYEGFLFILVFGLIIGLPCFFIAVYGSRMINDLGNFPTKTAQIQTRGWYWIIGVEVISFMLLVAFFRFFSS